jgi:hypothetical protein
VSKTLKKLIVKPIITPKDDGFLITCTVLQNVTLFKSEVMVSNDGTVTIENDDAVYDELPIRRIMLR